MELTRLVAPVAAATVLNLFLFAMLWRAHQQERRDGKGPWYLFPGLMAYAIPSAAFLYFYLDKPVTTYGEIFMAAVVGEALGIACVWSILNAVYFQRGQATEHRFSAFVGAGVMALIVFGLALA